MYAILLDIATVPATHEGMVDFSWLFLKMIFALIIVCIVAIVILKYAVPRTGLLKKFTGGKYISIIARHSLDHRKHLFIIKVGSKYMLIGAADHGINLIRDLDARDIE